jgi:hypothetical protein
MDFHEEGMPQDWNWLTLYKGKGDVKECGSYRVLSEATRTWYEDVGENTGLET